MTILPVKKKREKDSQQRSVSTIGSSAENSRQQLSGPSCSSSASSSSSAAKRIRSQEDGPPSKRWVLSASSTSSTNKSPIPSSSPVLPPPQPEIEPNRSQSPGNADYNSDDEYEMQNIRDDEIETEFSNRLAARGLIIKEMVGDGACMFRSIAEQIYGDQEMHGQIRRLCMDYMSNNRDHFKEFITENFENYIQRKREENVHGNHVELQAISEMFARPVEVYQYSDEPINVLLPRPEPEATAPTDGSASTSNAAPPPPTVPIQQNPPLRLSYHRAVHYNAILAPNIPTIGIGLGLPGMIPGSADKELMSKAMKTSELEHIEETMLQDKIDMTDFQRTQADIEDQITRESLISYLNDFEKSKNAPSTSAGAAPGSSNFSGEPPVSGSGLYEEMLAAQSLEWDAYTDDVAIAEAMLVSQQDYMSNKPSTSSSGSGPSTSE